jgi:hypothetical protein
MIADRARCADPAGFGQSLQSGGHVHPVAVDIIALDDDVADIDSDPEYDALFLWYARVPLRHPTLDRDGTRGGLNDARELDQDTVTSRLDDPTFVFGYLRINKFAPMGSEPRKSARLVLAHEAAVTGDISGENGRKTALYPLRTQCSLPEGGFAREPP